MTNKFLTLMLFIAASLITSCSSDDDSPQGPIEVTIEGATLEPEVGGPNQGNQVYVDLSTSETTSINRDAWDLGFYSGNEFRVILNSSLFMRAAELNTTDIDAVNSSSDEVIESQSALTGFPTFDASNLIYVDDPSGDINNTAISAVSTTDTNNKVYLVNLGDEVGTGTPENTGGVDLSDDPRGWIKIRVLRDGDDYLLQYADLDATTHNEVSISKNPEYNFTFFSLINETEVIVEPIKEEWDLNFSPNTSEVFFGPGNSAGAYFFGDFVTSNNLGGVKIYMIDTDVEGEIAYENFEFMNIDDLLFTNDQRGIGSTWRNTAPGSPVGVFENIYYIINDANGNYYKLKFLAMLNTNGERGYPQFQYELLLEE